MLKIDKTSTVPYTVGKDLKYDWLRIEWKQQWWSLIVNLENIALKQVPSEVLSMKVVFDRVKPKRYCDESKGFIYEATVTLTFENNLHEFSRNYVYELLCEVSQDDQRQPERLFSIVETRESSSINLTKSCFLHSVLNPQHLGFYIRRHNLDFCKNNMRPCMNLELVCQDVPKNVNLLVGNDTIPAHKFILSYKSEVFKAMFANEMTENKEGIVKIEDFNIDVIKEMVNFIYTGEVGNIEEIRYSLFKAAHQYQIKDLCFVCLEYILLGSNYENIAKTLDLADLYEIKELKERAWTFFNNHTEEMSREPSFQSYLCRSIKLDNVVDTLLVAKKYNISVVCDVALDFIGKNYCKMKDDEAFSKLFETNPCLMREIFHFYCERYASKNDFDWNVL